MILLRRQKTTNFDHYPNSRFLYENTFVFFLYRYSSKNTQHQKHVLKRLKFDGPVYNETRLLAEHNENKNSEENNNSFKNIKGETLEPLAIN